MKIVIKEELKPNDKTIKDFIDETKKKYTDLNLIAIVTAVKVLLRNYEKWINMQANKES